MCYLQMLLLLITICVVLSHFENLFLCQDHKEVLINIEEIDFRVSNSFEMYELYYCCVVCINICF